MIEAAKPAIMAAREEEGPTESRRETQATFDLKVQNKQNELNNCEVEVRNTFFMNSYCIEEYEKVPIIMNWQGLIFD